MTLDCLLCGVRGPQVRPRMVEWVEPMSKRWEVIPACSDVPECRQRVMQLGEPWPLVQTTNEREVLRDDSGAVLRRIVDSI